MKKTIRYFLQGAMVVAVGMIGSCSDDDKLPDVNGYSSSDEVAADNLLAHWTFNNTNNEEISGTAPAVTSAASFVDGVKGKALKLTNGYLRYPTIDALSAEDAIPSVTVSAWINITNTVTTATSIFALAQALDVQTDWNTGPLNMYAETGKPLTKNDTLVLHAAFSTYIEGVRYGGDNINDYGVRGTDFQTLKGTDRWVHYVMRYNGAESNIDIYADGVRISNNNFRHRTYGEGIGLGEISCTTPTIVVIGGWPNGDTGFTNSAAQTWQGKLNGSVDEIRVYNKALTDLEIGSLFALESDGR